jgi:hypothetical protein
MRPRLPAPHNRSSSINAVHPLPLHNFLLPEEFPCFRSAGGFARGRHRE